jgi:hypothetical protein
MRDKFTVISTEQIRLRGARRALSVTLDKPYVEIMQVARGARGCLVAEVTRSVGEVGVYQATLAVVSPIDAPGILSFADLGADDIAPDDQVLKKIAESA